MWKCWSPYGFNWSDNPFQIVRQHSRGVDQDWIKKANVDGQMAVELQNHPVEPGHTLVHIAPVADSEIYSCNVNGDGFKQSTNKVAHTTFLNGHLFREHDNKDPKKAFGRPVATAHNEKLARIELLADIENDKNPELVQKLEEGKPVDWSMSCSADPAAPVLSDRGYVPIERIRVGDMVMTHRGRYRRVYATLQRKYSGPLVQFKVKGIPYRMSFTGEHPFLALTRAAVGALVTCSGSADDRLARMDWTPASELQDRDKLMVVTGDRLSTGPVIDSIALARLVGYYLAEGSLVYNGDKACGLIFTVNASDSAYEDVPKLMLRQFGITTVLRPKANSPAAWSLDAFSTSVAEMFKKLCGAGVERKRIPPEIYNASEEIRLATAGAWLDGDGWYDKKGGHWSTVSFSLALSLRDMLLRSGIPVSIYAIDHSGQENAYGDSLEYTVNISPFDCRLLSPYSQKIRDASDRWAGLSRSYHGKAALQPADNGCAMCTAVQVETMYVENVTVYNISVEEDESYLVAGVATHNCKVAFDICNTPGCGNKATSRQGPCDQPPDVPSPGYCEHVKNHLGALMKNGHRNYVDNPNPNFFDCSEVGNAAEIIARSLGFRKAASEGYGVEPGMSGSELAEAIGLELPLYTRASLPDVFYRKLALAQKLSAFEKEMPVKLQSVGPAAAGLPSVEGEAATAMHGLQHAVAGKSLNSSQAMRSLRNSGVFMGLEDFNKVTGTASADEAKAAAVYLPHLFAYLEQTGCLSDVATDGSYDTYTSPVVKEAASWANRMAPAMSLFEEHVQRRLIARQRAPIIKAAQRMWIPADDSVSRLLRKYAAYQLSELAAHQEKNGQQVRIVLTALQRTVN